MNRSYSFILLTSILTLFTLVGVDAASGASIWVATDGSNLNGDGSFGNPYGDIAYGLSRSSDAGDDTVWVKPGVYQEDFEMPTWPVVLMSQMGAESTLVLLPPAGEITPTVYFGAFTDSSNIMDGFTVTGGDGPGIVIEGNAETYPNPEVRNCIIEENGLPTNGAGGGIYMVYAKPNIHHNLIRSNSCRDAGGGIYCLQSAPRIWNNEIRDNLVLNSDGLGGGGIAMFGSASSGSALVQNNLIIANRVADYYGGGMYLVTSEVNILNNLFYENESGNSGGGIYTANGYRPTVVNNIFSNNSLYAINCANSTAPGPFLNNCFYLNLPDIDADGSCAPSPETNFFDVNPQFVDAPGGDFHLQQTSLLINEGNSLGGYAYYNVDYDDLPRVAYAIPDIGPYEYVDCDLGADFSFEPAVACTSEVVVFTLLSTDLWQEARMDYGNGDADTIFYGEVGWELSSVYDNAGSYDAVLTLISECDTSIGFHTVEIIDRPGAAFSYTADDPVCAPALVSFTNESTGLGLIFQWQFGDGGTSSVPSPQHTFQNAGSYSVSLILSNDCGVDTMTTIFEVTDVPAVNFGATPVVGSAPLTVIFSDSSSFDPIEWKWDFGDGNNSALQNPIYTYNVPGQYDVGLVASNDCGDGDEVTRDAYVTVSGFDIAALEADTTDNLTQIFTVEIDTLFAPFNGTVALSTRFTQTPRRGSVTFTLSDDTVTVPDTVTVTAHLDRDLAQAEYQFSVIGSAGNGVVVDTAMIKFRAWPDALLELLIDSYDFGSVVVDSSRLDSLKITNVGPFEPPLDKLNLNILDVGSNNTAFVVTNPQSSSPIPTNGGVYYLRVRFTPPDTGEHTATLQILSDDPAKPIVEVELTGIGIPEFYPPTVVSTAPANAENDVPLRQPVLVQLSEELDSSSVDETAMAVSSTLLGGTVAGQVSLVDGMFLRFVPAVNVFYPPFDTVYVTVSAQITDLVGNGLDGNLDGSGSLTSEDDYSFSFVVGPAVFPGDCNNDGIVNEIDVLPVGVYFGGTGPSRARFNEGNQWGAKQADSWEDLAATYVDADGNGVIDERELLIIALNWGSRHDWADRTLPVDFDYQLYTENFTRLRSALQSMAGSEAGDQLLRVINTVAPGDILPSEFMLAQNYPNPFNPMTRIDYALPEATEVHLTVHNILGQTVKTLVNGYQDAGFKSVIWYGDDETGTQVSSGVYFFRLDAAGHSQIRKMLKLQ